MHGKYLRIFDRQNIVYYVYSPGRFFATNEVKAMLAHVLLNYDVKLPNNSGRPSELWFGVSSIPDPTAELMFRKRA